MPRLTAILLAALLPAEVLSAGPAPTSAADRWASLDAYIRQEMTRWGVPGLAIAVVDRNSAVFVRAYGVKQAGKPDPVDTATVMAVGSTTKAMTATLAAMLVDEGLLSWDDPVTRHLPWFQLQDPWVTREVTLRDLLSHRVGVSGAYLPAVTAFDRDEVLRRMRYMEPYLPFRARFVYSNVMYTAAGQVIAAVTGQTWEQTLKERLLDPLGMDGSHLTVDSLWPGTQLAPCFCCDLPGRQIGLDGARPGRNVAMPHMPTPSGPRVIPWRRYGNIGPAGGELSASIVDMAQWVRFLVGQGRFEGRRLLSAEAFEETQAPQMALRAEDRVVPSGDGALRRVAYGLGWALNHYRGRRMSWHSGGVYGFRATVGFLVDDGFGVVVLSNLDRAGLALALILRAFDQHVDVPAHDWSQEMLARFDAEEQRAESFEARLGEGRKSGTRPSLPLEQYAGRYVDPAYGEIRLLVEAGQLVLRFPRAQTADLEHWHHDVFRMRLRGPMAYPRFATFVIDSTGRVTSIDIEGLGDFARHVGATP